MNKRNLWAALAAFGLALAPPTAPGQQPSPLTRCGAGKTPLDQSWTVRAVPGTSRPRLQLGKDDGVRTTCVSLTLTVADEGNKAHAVKLVADGTRVRLTGDGIRAVADRVT